MREPATAGQIRQKVWQRQHLLSGDGELETWERRAIQYWALQGRKYGLVIDLEDVQNVIIGDHVVSRVMIAHVVPGDRISETAWRANNTREDMKRELGHVLG